ncbi:MAG: hypothetical protein ACUVXA_14955 [Candidatus Jordarchaeum sp.]|uniref:hypothetical protein n=1 Tax=Candidatus Jordarchaeum sp. TaxID=2823881 RepID=UPI004048F236
MKWKSHIAIAKAISKSLSFPKELEQALIEGIIEPDKHRSKMIIVGNQGWANTVRDSHHNPSLGTVMKYVWKARLSYLNQDNIGAVKNLGKALHYIQDANVSKGFLGLLHSSKEKSLLDQTLPEHAIKIGYANAICSPHHIESIIKSIKPSKSLKEIMNQACIYSAAITKAVLENKKPQNNFLKKFVYAKEKYNKRTLPLSLGVFLAFFIISINTFIFGLLGLWHMVLLSILGILTSYLTQRLDCKYHYLKKEAKWFGIR